MRKEEKENYKNAEISWSVYGEHNSYGSEACITIHAQDTIDITIVGEIDIHSTAEEAQSYIVHEAKKWIDAQIASGALKPIK